MGASTVKALRFLAMLRDGGDLEGSLVACAPPAAHTFVNQRQQATSMRLLFVGLALAIGLAGYLAFHGSGTLPPGDKT